MSRSQRKTPIFGVTSAASDADDKRLWHKRWRSRQRVQLIRGTLQEDLLPVHRREVSNLWDMAKEGKIWSPPDPPPNAAERLAAARAFARNPEQRALHARRLAKRRAK